MILNKISNNVINQNYLNDLNPSVESIELKSVE